jgi:hypothetical protein
MGARVMARLWLAVGMAIVVSGCAFDYIGATYTAPVVKPELVTVGCNTTYEVYDNRKHQTMMVRTNIGGELAEAICPEDRHLGPRMRRAVQIHLEKTMRPECRIVDERKLSPIHWEYAYACA